MIHLGDITKISGYDAPIVDCIVGGSPCQDLSVAGKRAGLDGERSGLFMEQIRIVKEMREHDRKCGRTGVDVRPRYMVWENVPGAFSSGKPKGADFAAVLEECIKVAEPEAPSVSVPEKGWPTSGCLYDEMGNWSVAWRVLDAQFWGTSDKPLPQRRRRIALVADFGGLSASEILFVRKGVSGDIEPGKPKGKETPIYAGEGSGGAVPYTVKIRSGVSVDSYGKPAGKGALIQTDLSATLGVTQDQTLFQPVMALQGSMIGRADQNGPQGDGVNEDVSFTLNTTDRHAVAYGIGSYHSNAWKSDNPNSGVYEADTAKTLDSLNCGYPGCNQGGMAVVQPMLASGKDVTGCLMASGYDKLGAQEMFSGDYTVLQPICFEPGAASRLGGYCYEDKCGTLRATMGDNQPAVAYSIENHPADSRVDIDDSGKVQTLTSRMGTGGGNVPMVMETFHATVYENVSPPLKARDYKDPHIVAGVDCRNATEIPEQNITLQSSCCHNLNSGNVVRVRHIVRRLTPLECERLQGFPDGWTDIGEWVDSKGKKHKEADSPRYKALGNSIALPPWKWVLKRLCACYERDATMASLFDGIGGFPLIWEQLNGKGSCLWSSEIEEFPMAVTRLRFGGDMNGGRKDA